jgi:hypothetical protein
MAPSLELLAPETSSLSLLHDYLGENGWSISRPPLIYTNNEPYSTPASAGLPFLRRSCFASLAVIALDTLDANVRLATTNLPHQPKQQIGCVRDVRFVTIYETLSHLKRAF